MRRVPGVKGEKIGPPPFPTPTQRRHRLVFRRTKEPPASLRSLSRSAFSFALLRPSQSLGLASDAPVPPARPRRASYHLASIIFRHFQLPVLFCAPNNSARDQGRQDLDHDTRDHPPDEPVHSSLGSTHPLPTHRVTCVQDIRGASPEPTAITTTRPLSKPAANRDPPSCYPGFGDSPSQALPSAYTYCPSLYRQYDMCCVITPPPPSCAPPRRRHRLHDPPSRVPALHALRSMTSPIPLASPIYKPKRNLPGPLLSNPVPKPQPLPTPPRTPQTQTQTNPSTHSNSNTRPSNEPPSPPTASCHVHPSTALIPTSRDRRATLLGQQHPLAAVPTVTITVTATHWFERQLLHDDTANNRPRVPSPPPTRRAILSAGPNSALPRCPSG